MVVPASWLAMGVGRLSRQLRGVGVLAMQDVELDATWRIEFVCEVNPGVVLLWQIVPRVAVKVFIASCWVADKVEVKHCDISATR